MDIKGSSGFKPSMPGVGIAKPFSSPVEVRQTPVQARPAQAETVDLQKKMHTLNSLPRSLSENKLVSDPVMSANIMRQLTEIALPLLGDVKSTVPPKEDDKKTSDKNTPASSKSEKETSKSSPDSSSVNNQKEMAGKKSFSPLEQAKKLMKREVGGESALFGGSTALKKDSEILNYFKPEVTGAGNSPTQEQLKQVIKHASSLIWDLLKKARKGEEKEGVTANILGHLMKMHSAYTFEHSNRVMDLTMALAEELGINDQNQLENLKNAAFFKDIGQYGPDNLAYLGRGDDEAGNDTNQIECSLRDCSNLHDIGKMKIPDTILNKNGPLTDDEFQIIKTHPLIGVEIVLPFPYLHGAIPGIRGHHEKWNGSGYPDRKQGNDIPLQARIISICDTFDAMTEDRPYRKALTTDQAVKELLRCSGTQFDPHLVPPFIYALGKKGEVNISLYEKDIQKVKEQFPG
jgi:HD-GYP domain-containing protein (c-di-GMP phosphodiesterase class II)